jgi:predicted enzyme related to lactoylglutathione lyase
MSFVGHRSLTVEEVGAPPAPHRLKGATLGQPVVHFEIIGKDPAKLRSYYGELFGWEFHTGDATTETVSQSGNYGFVEGSTTGGGIPGGVGGGEGYEPRVLFYVGVPNVEAALEKAVSLGGNRQMGPEGTPGTLMVGQFTDPEGNLVGVAGTE